LRLVYIAGKYRDANAWLVEQNVRVAEELAMAVAELGAMPVCPHSMCRHFDGTLSADFWLLGTRALMLRCDAVLFADNWPGSPGSIDEREQATAAGLPCFDSIDDLARWLEREST